MFKFFKYIILCLKIGYLEHKGYLTKEEGDAICHNFLDNL